MGHQEGNGRWVVAIDGKTIRGARSASRNAPHMVVAFDHSTGVVLGQCAVDAKSNEIPAVRDLIGGFDPADLRGCVITVDAMHTQDDTAKVIDTPDLPGWPELAGVAQVAQLRRTLTRAGKKTVEVVYVATSSSCQDAPPAVLVAWV